jgi:hypothetical protein
LAVLLTALQKRRNCWSIVDAIKQARQAEKLRMEDFAHGRLTPGLASEIKRKRQKGGCPSRTKISSQALQ